MNLRMLDHSGWVVLVTGGTSWISLDAAEKLVRQGASVVIAGLTTERGRGAIDRRKACSAARKGPSA